MAKNCVTINKKVVERLKSIEVVGDIIVPDIKPDIINIINTNGNAYIYKEDVSKGRIRIDGNLDTYIVYLSDNGETRSLQTTISFIEAIEDIVIQEGMIVKHEIWLENAETRVLNERKISVLATVKIKIECFEKQEIELLEDIENATDIIKLKEPVNLKSIIGVNRTRVTIREDIQVDSSCDIAEILKVTVNVENKENKISYNKVLAKADAKIKILFITEDDKVKEIESNVPIMSFIDIEKITEEHICNTDYVIRNMLIKPNTREMHSFNCQIDFEVSCEAFESKSIEVLQDMYGLKEDVFFSKKDVEVQINVEPKLEQVRLLENIIVEDINNILDVNCVSTILTSNKVGNFTNYEGEVKLEIFYESDNRNGLNVKKMKLPFIAKSELNESQIECRINKKNFRLVNETVECDIELQLLQTQSGLKKISVIENVERKPFEKENEYKMCVYFVKEGDTVWNISKEFRVCTDDIIKMNNLKETEKLEIGNKLYIMR